MADEAAKKATGWRESGPPTPPAARLDLGHNTHLRSAVGAWVKRHIKEEWKNNWQHADHGGFLRQWLPELDPQSKALVRYSGLTTPEASALFQARTGKIGFNHLLATIKRSKTALCPCEQDRETITHVLLHCTRYDALRRQLWGSDYTSHPQHTRDALTDPKYAPRTAKFLLATGRLPYLREMVPMRVTEDGEAVEVREERVSGAEALPEEDYEGRGGTMETGPPLGGAERNPGAGDSSMGPDEAVIRGIGHRRAPGEQLNP
ncbi:uncharacterized protein KD926_001255 [Aspergillus affinis]|uniref:uncharacterized protein n=1 Tax=Aspergillus affinis TaxID=1070780 RepID=UPI0022FDB975|nr:uncharacterized protein KD926_001255 [Aspergillus affinis]KAI9036867.1 hypothetical protein KD926_001255 [Aspergillus affinis]